MKRNFKKSSIDWSITVFPLVTILALAVFMVISPDKAASGIGFLRELLVNDLGFTYMVFGLAVVGISLYVALSKYGEVKLGDLEKPRYSTFSWGAMIFTSTMPTPDCRQIPSQ